MPTWLHRACCMCSCILWQAKGQARHQLSLCSRFAQDTEPHRTEAVHGMVTCLPWLQALGPCTSASDPAHVSRLNDKSTGPDADVPRSSFQPRQAWEPDADPWSTAGPRKDTLSMLLHLKSAADPCQCTAKSSCEPYASCFDFCKSWWRHNCLMQ